MADIYSTTMPPAPPAVAEQPPEAAPSPTMMPNMGDLASRLLKYALEGVAVALAAYVFSGRLKVSEIGMISLTAMATFAILDIYAPSVGSSARTGAGFGIGANLVGFPA